MLRAKLLRTLAGRIAGISTPHPLRVGIDGVDAAGKTTLADELAPLFCEFGRPVIRASIDGFHNPSTVRYRRGPTSPEGYFLDSFDHRALARVLLQPLGSDGSRIYRRAVFDFKTDRTLDAPFETAPSNAILLFDGVFLHRDELVQFWDFSVFLDVDFETTLARAEIRDAPLLGSAMDVRARYNRRYIPAQRLYLVTCNPRQRATVVIRNADPDRPVIADAG